MQANTLTTTTAGFPTGVENTGRGGSSKFDGEGLSQYMRGAWWGDLKCGQKNTSEGVHLTVKLTAISKASLQIH